MFTLGRDAGSLTFLLCSSKRMHKANAHPQERVSHLHLPLTVIITFPSSLNRILLGSFWGAVQHAANTTLMYNLKSSFRPTW